MGPPPYTKLLEENIALKLLLEEAHLYGNHAWECSTTLKKSDVCDCWYGKSAEMLISDEQLAQDPVLRSLGLVNLKDLVCKKCTHKADDHPGRLVGGDGKGVCCICGCSCMGFEPVVPKP